MNSKIPSQLSDAELVVEVAQLAASERGATATLVAHLAELDVRKLYLRAGYPSMFVYCTERLRLSEGGAYNRIEAARLARQFPTALDLLAKGLLNLGTLRLLASHLTPDNHAALLAAASGKSKRDVEQMLAGMFPKPDVAWTVRKLPMATTGVGTISRTMPGAAVASAGEPAGLALPPEPEAPTQAAPSPRGDRPARGALPPHPIAAALSCDRYQFRFTGSAATYEKFKRAQDLLRHAVPNGDPAEIIDRALTALLDDVAQKKFAATDRPREGSGSAPDSRTIPAAVKRAVMVRDDGSCALVAAGGRRCGATAFLEFHHVVPYARGGPATEGNIQLRCRAHNGYEAELDFGRRELVPGRAGHAERRPAGLSERDVDRPPNVLAHGAIEGHG